MGIRYEVRYSPETTHPAWQVTITLTGELMKTFESLPPSSVFVSPGHVRVWGKQDVSGPEAQGELHCPGPPLQPARFSAVEQLESKSPHLPGR